MIRALFPILVRSHYVYALPVPAQVWQGPGGALLCQFCVSIDGIVRSVNVILCVVLCRCAAMTKDVTDQIETTARVELLTGHALRVQVMRHHFAQCWVPRRNAATCVAQTEGATESVDNIEALLKAVPLEGATSTLNAWAILRFRGVDRKQYVCVIADAELRERVAGEWTETAENVSDAARAFMDAGVGEETPSRVGKRGARGSLSVRFFCVIYVVVVFV